VQALLPGPHDAESSMDHKIPKSVKWAPRGDARF
jgi:hypothetical protein